MLESAHSSDTGARYKTDLASEDQDG